MSATWWEGNSLNETSWKLIQLNLNYPDSLGLDEIVRIIEGSDNRKYGY